MVVIPGRAGPVVSPPDQGLTPKEAFLSCQTPIILLVHIDLLVAATKKFRGNSILSPENMRLQIHGE